MSKVEINTSDEPLRLFKSNFLEFFTHISPIAVLVIWLPVIGIFIYLSIISSVSVVVILVGFVLGLIIWTFAEYILHRFVFHFPAETPWQQRLSFLFHGIHHAQPRVKTRLVMPPAVSIPLAAIFLGLFYLIFGVIFSLTQWTSPIFAGFIAGYLLYDMLHYSTHHISMKNRYFRMVRRQHMHHHFKTPNMRFGVTSPIWDYVFGTMPKD